MRSGLLARRRAAPAIDLGCGPVQFEFAHLLDALARTAAELAPDVAPDVVADDVPAPEPDVVPELVPDIVVSRFADCGLDDDRLPIAVKRRRGRRG